MEIVQNVEKIHEPHNVKEQIIGKLALLFSRNVIRCRTYNCTRLQQLYEIIYIVQNHNYYSQNCNNCTKSQLLYENL